MSKRHNMTPDEAEKLFSELDASGVLDPDRAAAREGRAKRRLFMRRTAGATAVAEREAADRERSRARAGKIDPLSEQDPSGSQVGKTISRTAVVVILGVFVFVLGMQIVYGVSRRLNTANLSDRTNSETVEHAMESGVEWGNGFTQFPRDFTVDEASEKTGVVEVSVVDTDFRNELELLSNSQIQASALATNALLNEKINRVVYNVYALVDESGAFQHDNLFGFYPGARRAPCDADVRVDQVAVERSRKYRLGAQDHRHGRRSCRGDSGAGELRELVDREPRSVAGGNR